MASVALVMIAKNEEKVIGRCLESVKDLVDEMIVVDTGSTDRTKEIALSHGAVLYDYAWTDSFAEARNFALSKTTCGWSLVLDADDYISNDCGEALRRFINGDTAIGRVKIIDKFKGRDGVAYAQSFVSRLFPSNLRYEGRIHEQLVSELPRIKVDIEFQHDGYFNQSRSHRNIPLLQQEIAEQPDNAYFHYQIAKEFRGLEDYRSALKHLEQAYRHVDKRAVYYPNIVVDFIYAAMACGHLEPMVPIMEEERRRWDDFADMQFVSGLFFLELILKHTAKYMHLLPEIERSYRKCLEIGETAKYDSVMGTGSYSAHHNLGVYYEVTGDLRQAKDCYRAAAESGYDLSAQRLKALERK